MLVCHLRDSPPLAKVKSCIGHFWFVNPRHPDHRVRGLGHCNAGGENLDIFVDCSRHIVVCVDKAYVLLAGHLGKQHAKDHSFCLATSHYIVRAKYAGVSHLLERFGQTRVALVQDQRVAPHKLVVLL